MSARTRAGTRAVAEIKPPGLIILSSPRLIPDSDVPAGAWRMIRAAGAGGWRVVVLGWRLLIPVGASLSGRAPAKTPAFVAVVSVRAARGKTRALGTWENGSYRVGGATGLGLRLTLAELLKVLGD